MSIDSYREGDEPWLRVTIADDGVGIGPDAQTSHGSRNIQTRIQSLGGHVTQSSGEGTTISMSMPLRVTPPDGGMGLSNDVGMRR